MSQCWRAVTVVVTVLVAVGLGIGPASGASMNLHRGSKGAQVRTLEVRLNTLKLLPRSQVDRRYTASTVRAVKRFQRQQKLRVTGKVNRRTWDRVASEVRRRTTPPKPPPAPTILGHRGAVVADIPENTMASMRYASTSADILEFDLRLTLDKRFVLLHDENLERTTNCTGKVAEVTLEYLQATCVTDIGAQQIPTFDEVAAYAASVSKSIAPELKSMVLSPDDYSQFVTVLRTNDLVTRSYVQSFDKSFFGPLEAAEPQLRFVYLVASSARPATVSASGATIVGSKRTGLTAARVAAFRAAGLRVWAWTAST